MHTSASIKAAVERVLGWSEGEAASLSLRSVRELLLSASKPSADRDAVVAEIDRVERTGAVVVGDAALEAIADHALDLASQAVRDARLEHLAGQQRAIIEAMSAIPEEDRIRLKAWGYEPSINWKRRNMECSTGSALKNIEIDEARAVCGRSKRGHENGRGSEVDFCRHCGHPMPTMVPRR